ncbi:single-stranded DNA-binding protein [Mycoplasma sp. VS299A]|uniref:single-stranded DNA-binding protein n=1 Tax=unclassified Mycoplasma TaxID=2683645 RepID=UPI003AAB400E
MNKLFLSGSIAKSSVKKITSDKVMVYTFQIRCKKEYGQGYDFITVTAFGKTAEHFEKFYKENKFIEIIGHINQTIFTDKNEKKQYKEQVIADEIHIIETKTLTEVTENVTDENDENHIDVKVAETEVLNDATNVENEDSSFEDEVYETEILIEDKEENSSSETNTQYDEFY